MHGLHAALELLAREVHSLGVMRERVVCIGTSMGAVCAMVGGFLYGAGRIVVGAAPIRCGTALEYVAGTKSRHKAAAPELLALAAAPGGSAPVDFLDGWILDLALRSTSRCRIDLLTSSTDFVGESTHEFARVAGANPLLDIHVHTVEYGKHGGVGEAFFPFLRNLLAKQPRTLQV